MPVSGPCSWCTLLYPALYYPVLLLGGLPRLPKRRLPGLTDAPAITRELDTAFGYLACRQSPAPGRLTLTKAAKVTKVVILRVTRAREEERSRAWEAGIGPS